MLIEKIIEEKKKIVDAKKRHTPLIIMKKGVDSAKKSLVRQIKENKFSLIAEIKRASPSAGPINKDINIEETALAYQTAGAAGISVLTCEPYFLGSIEDLQRIKKIVDIPVLLKDFIIDPYQIREADAFGADVILLIVRILDIHRLKDYVGIAEEHGLEILIEVHNAREMEIALKTVKRWDNKILGINNRNLETLQIDIGNTIDLIKFTKEYKIEVISESGIRQARDITRLKKAGVGGALVGESILKSTDIKNKIKYLINSQA